MEELNEKNKANGIEIKGLTSDEQVKKRKARKRKLLVSVFVLLLALGIGGISSFSKSGESPFSLL